MDRYLQKYKDSAHELITQFAGTGKTVEEAKLILDLAKQEIDRITNELKIPILRM